jgi:phage terminase small subunit
MARPRTPIAKAEATGRTVHDPQRYRDRKEPANKPLGEPSRMLKFNEPEAYKAFKRELPWLTEGDRIVVEAASMLRARLMSGSRDPKVIGQLLALCREMGATPATRSKIHVTDDGEADPANEFLN